MKIFDPVVKIKGFAKQQSIELSTRALEKTEKANNYLIEIANVFLFISRTVKETFSKSFEFNEFLRQCYQIGNKSLPLISVTGLIMGLVLTIQSRPVLLDFGAVTMLPGFINNDKRKICFFYNLNGFVVQCLVKL